LVVYLVLSYLLEPLVRRYRHRYHDYLPLNRLSLQQSSTSLRHRIWAGLTALGLPFEWLRRIGAGGAAAAGGGYRGERHGALRQLGDDSDGEDDVDDETAAVSLFGNGEHLVGLPFDPSLREDLERRRTDPAASERRLSRDLEEGFRDNSSDSDSDGGGQDDRRMKRAGNGLRRP
jgi:hypothetical protein